MSTDCTPPRKEPETDMHASKQHTVDGAEFWENFYQTKRIPWDIGKPAPPFVSYLNSPDAVPEGKMIILGCGTGHECLLFRRQGFSITAVDFAPSPVQILQERLASEGLLGEKSSILQRNIFDLSDLRGQFDYVLEHTCFCAIHPSRRREYVEVVHSLLRPQGRFIALFWLVEKPGNPPYGSTRQEIIDLFSARFNIQKFFTPGDSTGERAGQEIFAVMQPNLS